jgi:hypothetical protein
VLDPLETANGQIRMDDDKNLPAAKDRPNYFWGGQEIGLIFSSGEQIKRGAAQASFRALGITITLNGDFSLAKDSNQAPIKVFGSSDHRMLPMEYKRVSVYFIFN